MKTPLERPTHDLPFSQLIEIGHYDESVQVLEKAVMLAPPEYGRPSNTLREVRRRAKEDKGPRGLHASL